jgi:hypothetical protein
VTNRYFARSLKENLADMPPFLRVPRNRFDFGGATDAELMAVYVF